MDGLLTGRRRRPLWAWLAVLFLAALIASLFLARRAQAEAVREAASQAVLLAQTEIATMLEPGDLLAPVTDERAAGLSAQIRATVTGPSSIDGVRIYSAFGRILYAEDTAFIGTRPSYLRDLTFEVANGDPQTHVRGGDLQTFVPIWLSPDGTVVVAEISQSLTAVTGPAAARWTWTAIGLAIVFAGALAMVVVTTLDRPLGPEPRRSVGRTKGMPALAYREPGPAVGAVALEARPDPRVAAAERHASELQRELREAKERVAALERQHASRGSGSEADELRAQLARATEQLHMAELDGRAVRERLAARQQELDEARAALAARGAEPGEAADLRSRLEEAEAQTRELTERLERAEAELETATTQLSMTRLSEALREIEREGHDDEEPEASWTPGGLGRTVP